MNGNHIRHNTSLATLLGFSLLSAPLLAEDIEVFFTNQANNVAPNVLFILDSSDSMNEITAGSSRMDVLKTALGQVLKPTPKYTQLNVGIMDFSGSRSGGIDFPVTDINSDANLIDSDIPADTDVGTVVDYISQSYTASGNTPMGDALYFASSYYSGANIFNYGGRSSRNVPNTWDTTSNSYTGGHREADNPATYTGSLGFTTTAEISTRACSTSNPRPIRSCGSNYTGCSLQTQNSPGHPKRYRIRTYSCDSSGLECSWDSPGYRDVDANYPGDSSCSDGQPSNPVAGTTWVQCDAADPPSSYEYQRCQEDYNITTWAPTPVYNSPISQQCQKNHIVMLSDGEPTSDNTHDEIANRVDSNCADLSQYGSNISNNGICLPELTEYMATVDQSGLPNDQTVSTHTIGFKLSGNQNAQDFLELLATKGNGKYYDANSPQDLVNVFKQIINTLTSKAVNFSSPSVNIDQNNRLATSEYLYRADFTPVDKPRWSGDIVKVKIGKDSAGNPTFTDDPTTLASTLVASVRKIYTITGTDYDLTTSTDENVFETSNTELITLLEGLGVSDPAKLIQWTRGIDVKDENDDTFFTDERKYMGDSLHTTPALVTYNNNKQMLFVTTNQGMLHAFEVTNGGMSETFAFIPPALLGNLDTLYNNSNIDSKVYGLDGNLSIWQNGNKVILYFGMRRGGRDYYALDVSSTSAPKLLWHIEGGQGDFAELGQSWSTPQLTKIKDSSSKDVMALIFAGGYDTQQDDTDITTRAKDTVGRGIFIVDAEKGTKIWSAGPIASNFDYPLPLENSIPSDVRIIDLDGNGRADRLYVGDMGSRVWRIDLDQDNISNSSGYQLADFNGGTVAGNRRFYYAPSISFDRNRRLMVAIGSGYRSHPAESGIVDRFYAFEDANAKIGAPTLTPSVFNESKLGDVSGDPTSQNAYDSGVIGWRIDMDSGEKVLAESIIFNNNVAFTSYQPTFSDSNTLCDATGNTPRAYMLALEDGRPVRNLDGAANGALNRFRALTTVPFIPSAPYITFNKPDSNGNQTVTSIIGGDKQTADLYVGRDQIDSDSFLTDRISWQNQ